MMSVEGGGVMEDATAITPNATPIMTRKLKKNLKNVFVKYCSIG